MKNTELALAINEPFGSVSCNFYRHPERLDKYSIITPLEKRGVQNELSPSINSGGEQFTYLYSAKGIMEICRHSNQPKADQFIDFVWDVMDKLIKGDLALLPTSTVAATDLIKINQQMAEIGKYLTGVNEKLAAMEQEQRELKLNLQIWTPD